MQAATRSFRYRGHVSLVFGLIRSSKIAVHSRHLTSGTRRKPKLSVSTNQHPYGLKRVRYDASNPPPRWPIPPPPPPSKNPLRRNFPFLTLALGAALAIYVYVNRDDENVYEYWRQVEQGNVPLDDDDDDDDDDDSEEEEEEDDEWSDQSPKDERRRA